MKKFIMIRACREPWVSYDLKTLWRGCFPSREQSYIEAYIKAWDDIFSISFLEARDMLRAISLENFSKVENVTDFIYHRPRKDRGFIYTLDGLVASTDDDDFYAPWLFDHIVRMIDGKKGSFFWHAYCSGHMSRDVFGAGSFREETYPHTNNIAYDVRKEVVEKPNYNGKKKSAKLYKGAREIGETLSFYNCHPWGKSLIRRMIVNKWDFWEKFSLSEKQLYLMQRYIKKSKETLVKIEDSVWFKPYWEAVVKIAEDSVGDKVDYDFPLSS